MRVYIFITIISAICLSAVIYAFTLVGSPLEAAQRASDQNTFQKLFRVAGGVYATVGQNHSLPKTASEILSVYKDDDKTKVDYSPLTKTSFQLCADFLTKKATGPNITTKTFTQTNMYDLMNGIGSYDKGRNCLKFTVEDQQIQQQPEPPVVSTAAPCPTAVVSGICQLNNCSYTYPNDIYTKGTVVVGDFYKKLGQQTGTFTDKCTDSGQQVQKMQCSGNPKDPYNLGTAIYNCPKGCSNGACIR